MKFNYRDKVIAAILLAIVILLVGFLVPVKNQSKQNKADKKILADREATKKEYESKIAQIPSLKETILDIYDKTADITKNFVPVDEVLSPVTIDKYMQKFADENNIKVENLQLSATAIAPLDYYYTKTDDSFAELRAYADINGTLQQAFDEEHKEGTAISQRAKENVMRTQYGVEVYGTKKNLWKYLEAIKNFDKAVVINSVTINDPTFGEEAAEAANVTLPESKDGEEVSVQAGDKEIKNTSKAQLVITLYSVYEMEKPDVDSE